MSDWKDKVTYWQGMHFEAGQMLCHMHAIPDYFSAADYAYIKAWQERQAYCYRQVTRWRGF